MKTARILLAQYDGLIFVFAMMFTSGCRTYRFIGEMCGSAQLLPPPFLSSASF